MSASFLDANGQAVTAFSGRIRNLARVAELTQSIIEMAESGAWRQYRTALGEQEWREAEYDYFLIACQLQRDDVARVLAWNGESAKLAPLMDRDADSSKRRPIEAAAASWKSPGGTLLERAQAQGWTRSGGGLNASPIPRRAQLRATTGLTLEEQARRARAEHISADRRRALDAIVNDLIDAVPDETERRYLVDRLLRR